MARLRLALATWLLAAVPAAALECLEGHPHGQSFSRTIAAFYVLSDEAVADVCAWEGQPEDYVYLTLWRHGLESGQILVLRPGEDFVSLLARDPLGRELERFFTARGLCPLSNEELLGIKQRLIPEPDFRDLGQAIQARGFEILRYEVSARGSEEKVYYFQIGRPDLLAEMKGFSLEYPGPDGPWPYEIQCGAGHS